MKDSLACLSPMIINSVFSGLSLSFTPAIQFSIHVSRQCPLTSGGVLTTSEHPPGISIEIFRAIFDADESRMSQMPQGPCAVRTIGMTYGLHAAQLRILITPGIHKPFTENSSVASPRTHHIHGGYHKDIMDSMDVFMDEKYDP